jgi:hypothetical protein
VHVSHVALRGADAASARAKYIPVWKKEAEETQKPLTAYQQLQAGVVLSHFPATGEISCKDFCKKVSIPGPTTARMHPYSLNRVLRNMYMAGLLERRYRLGNKADLYYRRCAPE